MSLAAGIHIKDWTLSPNVLHAVLALCNISNGKLPCQDPGSIVYYSSYVAFGP